MIYRVSAPEKQISVSIHLPYSKSESNRALIIRALCNKKFSIKNISNAEDTKLLQDALKISAKKSSAKIHIGHAGTAMRFLTAYLAVQKGKEFILDGSERMRQRPIGILVNALRQLGAKINYLEKENYPPLKIKGKKLNGGEIEIDGNISSQYISALLMIAPKLRSGLKINFKNEIVSKPYIEMTLRQMKYFGAKYIYKKNFIEVEQGKYIPKKYSAQADWSAASYWYEIVALSDNATIFLNGLKKKSLQGDAVIASIYEQFGVKTEYSGKGIKLSKISNFQFPSRILGTNF